MRGPSADDDFSPWISELGDCGPLFLNIVLPCIPGLFVICFWITLDLCGIKLDQNATTREFDQLDCRTPEARKHLIHLPSNSDQPSTACAFSDYNYAFIPESMRGITRIIKSPITALQQVTLSILTLVSITLAVLFFFVQSNLAHSLDVRDQAIGFSCIFLSSIAALCLYQKETTRTYLQSRRPEITSRLVALRIFWMLTVIPVLLRFYSSFRHWAAPSGSKWHCCLVLANLLLVFNTALGIYMAFSQPNPRENPFERIREAFHVLDLRQVDATIPGKPVTPELSASLFRVLTFTWLQHLISLGRETLVNSTDMYTLKPNELAVSSYARFYHLWEAGKAKKINGWTFWKVLFKFLSPSLYYAAGLKFVYDSLTMVNIMFLNLLVKFMSSSSTESTQQGLFFAFLMGVNALIETCVLHQYFHRMMSLGNSLKSCIGTAVYTKSLVLDQNEWSGEEADKFGVGKILNLMSNDAQKVGDLMDYGNTIWSAPYQITIISILLYLQLGVCAFAGIFVMVLSLPITLFFMKRIRSFVKPLMTLRDRRLKCVAEMIQGIKAIKVYGWEDSKFAEIQNIRNQEMALLRKIQLYQLANRVHIFSTPMIVSIVTFGFYCGWFNNELTPAVAFTSLALFNNLRFPLFVLPMAVTNIAEAAVSIQRLQQFLLLPELTLRNFIPLIPKAAAEEDLDDEPFVDVQGLTVQFKQDIQPIFENISFRVHRGEQVGLTGRTGCGKSVLLAALLRDIKPTAGDVIIRGHLAFCSQVPWIQSGTVRENILFGRPFDRKWYEKVLHACALKSDLQILADGDRTQIGERGVNLSGGQKQRIALARAVYRDADVYIFDDVLSAVDTHVEEHIYKHVFLDLLKDKAIILATHRFDCLQTASKIIMLKRGDVEEFDSIHTAKLNPDFQHLADEVATDDPTTAPAEEREHAIEFRSANILNTTIVMGSANPDDASSPLRNSPSLVVGSGYNSERSSTKRSQTMSQSRGLANLIFEDETIQEGKVKGAVYTAYFQAGGGFRLLAMLLLFMLGGQSLTTFSGFWLSAWSDSTTMKLSLGLGLYAGIQAGSILVTSTGFYFMTTVAINASRTFHKQILDRVIHATLGFFETNPIGRLTNRFGKEIDRVDEKVPWALYQFTLQSFIVLATIATISIVLPVLILVLIPILGIYVWIERIYVSVARQFQRITSVTRSPVFSNFSETLDGVKVIRAFLENNQFKRIHLKRIDEHLSAQYVYLASNRWLAVRLETLGTLLVVCTAFASVLSRGTLAAALTGLALTHAISITGSLNWVVRMSGEREASIISVERLTEYNDEIVCPQETYTNKPHLDLYAQKPGTVEFDQVSLRYRPGLPFALKSVCIKLVLGEKVGIVGRTGAGKSSLLSTLLRLVEITDGRIYVHGRPIELQSVLQLRNSVSIIPQESVLFAGTIRSNLDPFNQYSDERIWEALDRSCLSEYVRGKSDGLDFPINEGGSNMSAGQKQLLCLARVLLRDTKLLLLDEATSAVDPQTDAYIQKAIRTEFKSSTVLTVAHRLKTVLDYDRIIVMADGQPVESGPPQELLKNRGSMFYSMYTVGR